MTSTPAPERINNWQLFQLIGRLALPVLLTNLLQSLVGVIDLLMVGRLSPLDIAAAGMGNTIRILVLVLVLSVAAGAMSMIAQARGARDPARMELVTRQSISAGLMLSMALLIIGLLLARPLLLLANSGGDPAAIPIATSYLQILFLGMPFLVLNIVFNRLMQGAGDTVTPLILTLGLNVLNIICNYMFMFGIGPLPEYGLAGAAIGTVVSRAVGVGLALTLFSSGRNVIKLGNGSFRPNWQLFRDIFGIGIPSGIQGIFRNGSRLLVVSLATSSELGSMGAAALAIGVQVESLAFMPVLGINVAATALVGQSIGSWQPEEAKRRGNMSIVIGLVLMIALTAPLSIFSPAIIRLFDPSANPLLQSAGTEYLRISTPFLAFTAIAMVANGSMRGAGDTKPGMYSTMMTRGVTSVVLAWLFAFPLGYGSTGIWVALAIGLSLDGIYLLYRWRSDAWLDVALHSSDIYRTHLSHLSSSTRQRYLRDVRTALMQHPTAVETVSEQQVEYVMAHKTVTVLFDEGDYTMAVSDISETLPPESSVPLPRPH